MKCPHCDSENVFYHEQVEVRQSVMEIDGSKVIINREHEIVSDDSTTEIENIMICGDCAKPIEMPDDYTIELFPKLEEKPGPSNTKCVIDYVREICTLTAKRAKEEAGKAEVVHEIYTVLRDKFNGKKITRRLATLIQNAHPSWTVYYDKSYGSVHLSIWGGDSGLDSFSDRMHILVGYEDDLEEYDPSIFPKRAVCYYAGLKRNEKRAAFLDSEDPTKLALLMNKFQRAREELKAMLDEENVVDSGSIMEIYGENMSQFYV